MTEANWKNNFSEDQIPVQMTEEDFNDIGFEASLGKIVDDVIEDDSSEEANKR